MTYATVVRVLAAIVVGLGQASEPELAGRWEGEIEDARRPLVLHVDFTAGTASLSGGTPVPLTRRDAPASSRDDAIAFDIVLGANTLKVTGARTGARIRASADLGDRTLPFYLERLPDVAPPSDRADAWRQDLDVVLTRFLRYDRSFTDDQRAAARTRLERLKSSAGQRTDAEILVELARAVGMSGNAHTRLYLVRNRTEVRRLPVRVWWFRDELRIVRTTADHRQLLGCRVTKIGDMSTDAVVRRVRDIKPGNASWQRYMSAYFLTSPELLSGAGVVADAERVPVTVACEGAGGATRGVMLSPLPLRRSSTPVEAWWDLAPSSSSSSSSSSEGTVVSALAMDKAPRYLRHADQHYWFEYVPELEAIYLQYNRSQPMPNEPMSGFIERLLRAVDERPLKGLIVDVRFNTGGDAGVARPLVDQLATKLGATPVVILTSRATFSAGLIHAVQWKQRGHATVIGEPVGDDLDFWAEGGNVLLPNSKLTVHYANGFHTYSRREYPRFRPYFYDLNVDHLDPDVRVEPSWRDYIAGRDPLFDAAASRMRSIRR